MPLRVLVFESRTVLGHPERERESFVFVTLLLQYFSDVGFVARLSECAAKERLAEYKETNP